MDWSLRLVTPPEAEPLTLTQVKKAVRLPVDYLDEDDDLAEILAAARNELEQEYNIRFVVQTVELLLQDFPRAPFIRFPIWPVQEVLYFRYTDTAGTVREMEVDDTSATFAVQTRLYRKPAEVNLPFSKFWPSTILRTADAIAIGLKVGYVSGKSPEELPTPPMALSALKRLIEHGYRYRGAVTLGSLLTSDEMKFGVSRLMANVGLAV